jgi:5-methylcytosine-specific restriction endonuclease McrA
MARKAKISTKVRATVLARDNHICRACGFGGSENYAFALHCDHIVPEADGGATAMDNLQTLCAHCNGKKGDRVAHQFPVRAAVATEAEWAANQKVVAQAFGTPNASIRARILRALQ